MANVGQTKGKRPRRRGDRPPLGRRTPPSPRTGLEAKFYETKILDATPVVLMLVDGREVRGVIREFDRDQLTLDGENGQILVRKSEIRYLYEGSE
jgi:sRNA-binding regulator protein Hfq